MSVLHLQTEDLHKDPGEPDDRHPPEPEGCQHPGQQEEKTGRLPVLVSVLVGLLRVVMSVRLVAVVAVRVPGSERPTQGVHQV